MSAHGGSAALSYVLPLRMSEGADGREQLSGYLRELSGMCEEVIVVDGSPEPVFSENRRAWGEHVRHLAPDPAHRCLMGKVAGVLTGVHAARNERVVLADDDVRYDARALARVARELDAHDLVRPQNYFQPLPWHARWDTARTLINRALGADFPGTLGVRRSLLIACGGYDGDVMFENLELIRTVEAAGGRVASPLDLYVRRLPPSASHFWGQRTRQAYDDFATPGRMATWLALAPAGVLARALGARRARQALATGVLAATLIAEAGRRRAGGARVFPLSCSLLAPAWVAERGVCAWLAVWQRARFGGVRYRDSVIPTAAHSTRELRKRLRSRS
ncbi:MAG TPA: glycosyltransferase family 2 protein [Solirubrobacteraceae bacterium]|nr:glycosyltransferase family 2 protein [Solirubrobacteraceae bacterium]